jgi:hypothetical protein
VQIAERNLKYERKNKIFSRGTVLKQSLSLGISSQNTLLNNFSTIKAIDSHAISIDSVRPMKDGYTRRVAIFILCEKPGSFIKSFLDNKSLTRHSTFTNGVGNDSAQ